MSSTSRPGNPDRRPARIKLIAIITAVAVLVIAAVILIMALVGSPKPETAQPSSTVGGQNTVPTEAPLSPPAMIFGAAADTAGAPKIDIYADYSCHWCAAFEQVNGEYLDGLIAEGAATVEFHPVAALRASLSERGTAAAACVAEVDQAAFPAFNSGMFGDQNPENMTDYSDAEIVAIAAKAGVSDPDAVQACITEKRFDPWTAWVTQKALSQPLPGFTEPLQATPTVLVNGKKFESDLTNPAEFKTFVEKSSR